MTVIPRMTCGRAGERGARRDRVPLGESSRLHSGADRDDSTGPNAPRRRHLNNSVRLLNPFWAQQKPDMKNSKHNLGRHR